MLGDHVLLHGANSRLVVALSRSVPVFYGAVVKEVDYRGPSSCRQGAASGAVPAAVRVRCEGGREFAADACVVTLPLGVLKRRAVRFTPELPAEKRRAIDALGFGAMNKCILLFSECFWGDAALSGEQCDTFGRVAEGTGDRGEFFLFYRRASSPGVGALLWGSHRSGGPVRRRGQPAIEPCAFDAPPSDRPPPSQLPPQALRRQRAHRPPRRGGGRPLRADVRLRGGRPLRRSAEKHLLAPGPLPPTPLAVGGWPPGGSLVSHELCLCLKHVGLWCGHPTICRILAPFAPRGRPCRTLWRGFAPAGLRTSSPAGRTPTLRCAGPLCSPQSLARPSLDSFALPGRWRFGVGALWLQRRGRSPQVGASGEDYEALAAPVAGRLFFAGEATTRRHPATMHGAYLSGETAPSPRPLPPLVQGLLGHSAFRRDFPQGSARRRGYPPPPTPPPGALASPHPPASRRSSGAAPRPPRPRPPPRLPLLLLPWRRRGVLSPRARTTRSSPAGARWRVEGGEGGEGEAVGAGWGEATTPPPQPFPPLLRLPPPLDSPRAGRARPPPQPRQQRRLPRLLPRGQRRWRQSSCCWTCRARSAAPRWNAGDSPWRGRTRTSGPTRPAWCASAASTSGLPGKLSPAPICTVQKRP